MTKKPFDQLTFDNRFANELPADPATLNTTRQVEASCYSRVLPTPVSSPSLIAHSAEVLSDLGLADDSWQSPLFTKVLSGNTQLAGMDPYAMCYGGHQFGNWAGQLGDGRAINLGTATTTNGPLALQLKGAGPTPYSRHADGLAVMRSSVREFLCSEAMFHLGVPTTRALSLIATGDPVVRDMFYDGNAKPEPGAVVCRVAPSFIRFGNFEIFAARGDHDNLRRLVEFAIKHDYPHLGQPNPNNILAWFAEVCQRTAQMIAQWLRVGFVHGVMNTDNMSILGLTIDYGPYGWLEGYDPSWTPNTTDAGQRRYCYGQQPRIAHWNLMMLANALHPLIGESKPFEEILETYSTTFQDSWQTMMASKLGFSSFDNSSDHDLVTNLFETFNLAEVDMTLFFRLLAELDTEDTSLNIQTDHFQIKPLLEAYYDIDNVKSESLKTIADWIRLWRIRVNRDGKSNQERQTEMNKINPKYVLRNWIAQLAIDKAEEGDGTLVMDILEMLRRPYMDQPKYDEYFARRPEWARNRAGCSMLSCSS